MNIAKLCRVSSCVNCWKINVNNKIFAIMPAHVAILNMNDRYRLTGFLKTCDNRTTKKLDWYVPDIWITNPDTNNDLCWAEIKSADTDMPIIAQIPAINSSKLCLDDPIDSNFWFHQPYSYKLLPSG